MKWEERLVHFCEDNGFDICNILLECNTRRLYTRKCPGDISRNQTDCLTRERSANTVECAKSHTGDDIRSDYNPVVIKVNIKFMDSEKHLTSTSNGVFDLFPYHVFGIVRPTHFLFVRRWNCLHFFVVFLLGTSVSNFSKTSLVSVASVLNMLHLLFFSLCISDTTFFRLLSKH